MTAMKKNEGAAAQLVELGELAPQGGNGPSVLGDNIGLLDGVPVAVSVMVGEARSTVGELLGLKEHAVLKIDRPVDAPVDVIVNGNVVARGQLVVVDEHFGVRITAIAATAA